MAVARARIAIASSIMLGGLGVMIAGAAVAQVQRPLVASGTNLRFQIGGELEIPIAATRQIHTPVSMSGTAMVQPSCIPRGGIKGVNPIPGAKVTTWKTGRLRILTSQFTLRGKHSNRQSGLPYTAKVIGVKTQNPVALQVRTYFQIMIPKPSMTMTPTRGLYVHPTGAGPAKARKHGGMTGRTGPETVSFCAGSTTIVTMGMNPGCANPLGGPFPVKIHSCPTSQVGPCPGTGYQYEVIKGYMKYRRTNKMLGGPANGTLRGPADVAIGATGGGIFIIPLDIKSADPAIGGSFGQFFQQNAGMGPHFKNFSVNACGIVKTLMTLDIPKAQSNRTTASFGGPLTQGTLTVAAATNAGVEKYVLKGYDNRTAMGAGKLRLVTGSISKRQITGSNANQGVLTFQVPEPTSAAGAAAALLVLWACHRVMNRRR